MTEQSELREYPVLSRGQWNATASREEIQAAINAFYVWYQRSLESGLMKPGHRLTRDGKVVSKYLVTDGPFAETKELVGGYWFIVARNLEEAAAIAAQNPTLAFGLKLEIRPLELARADVLVPANETPAEWDAK